MVIRPGNSKWSSQLKEGQHQILREGEANQQLIPFKPIENEMVNKMGLKYKAGGRCGDRWTVWQFVWSHALRLLLLPPWETMYVLQRNLIHHSTDSFSLDRQKDRPGGSSTNKGSCITHTWTTRLPARFPYQCQVCCSWTISQAGN